MFDAVFMRLRFGILNLEKKDKMWGKIDKFSNSLHKMYLDNSQNCLAI